MLFFICLDLILGYLIQTNHPWMSFFLSEECKYLGITLVVLAAILIATHKLSLTFRHDIFCCGSVLIWISTWTPFFNDDSPVIFFYPVYFCLLTIFVTFCFVQQAPKIDALSISYLEKINDIGVFNVFVMMAIVIVSLNLVQNYLLYPTVMTLFLAKHAFSSILEIYHNQDLARHHS